MQGDVEDPVATDAPAEAMTLTLAEATAAAVRLLGQKRLPQAEPVLQAVIDADPENADALHFLGVLRAQQGRGDDAIALIRRALDANPRYADAWNNLGLLLRAMPHYSAALEAFDKAAEYDPHLLVAHLNRAQLLRRRGQLDESAAAFRRVLELDPTRSDVYRDLGNLLYRMGHLDEAAEVYGNWSRIEPQNPVAAHMAAAYRTGPSPLRASDDYVRATFDRFAPAFDQNMMALEYRAPALVTTEVARTYAPQHELDVLDAGCGTGLCGPMLAPYARRLIGVDLSEEMIIRALQRGPYDELHLAELTEHLKSNARKYDLIVAADSLIYFGLLNELMAAASEALRDEGHLVFTVERLGEGSGGAKIASDFFLNPHGRYSHAEPYLRRCVAAAGFELVSLRSDILRQENSAPVDGFVVTARKSRVMP